jgi:general stress protein 26
MDWQDVATHLTGLAHMATVTPDGRPHVSVVSPAVDGGTVWIGTSRASTKALNLVSTPMAALVWQSDAEVYVRASVDLVDDLDTKRRLWEGGGFAYDPAVFFGSVDHPDFVLLRLTPTSATVMEMTERGPSRRHWSADRTT